MFSVCVCKWDRLENRQLIRHPAGLGDHLPDKLPELFLLASIIMQEIILGYNCDQCEDRRKR